MEGGRIVVPQADADITMASGQINIANATMRAQGGATLSLRGMLDLKEEAVDANLKLTQPSPANALTQLPPELTIAVRGPLAAPERTLDLSVLMGWLTLRVTEQQTWRLESSKPTGATRTLAPLFARPHRRYVLFGRCSAGDRKPRRRRAGLRIANIRSAKA